MKNILQRLIQAFGPSGREEEIRSVLREELAGSGLELKTDVLGNLIATKAGRGGRLMIAAHMDEIGLLVTHIDDKGFLRFTPIGGQDPKNLLGSRVIFANGIMGTIGGEKIKDAKEFKLEKLYLDIGATAAAEAKELVAIGSMAVFVPHFTCQGNRIIGKSLDNRAGCALLLAVIRDLPPVGYQIDFVFSVQEEVGLRGARTAAYHLEPHLALAVDVTRTGDTPESGPMAVELGGGPAIKVKDTSLISHPRVRGLLEKAAKERDIPFQLEVLLRGGTDAGSIHLSRAGVPSGVISIPTRYVHSPAEMIDYRDLTRAATLLSAFMQQDQLFMAP